MAADVTRPAATPATGAAPEGPVRQSRLRPFWNRFAIVYTALALALGAGIAGLVIVLTQTSTSGSASTARAAAWSTWRPEPGEEATQLSQIVKHVSPGYRLPNGDPLVNVLTKAPPAISSPKQTIPIRFVAVKGVANPDQLTSTNSVLFKLCGLGATCSIATGTPTVARARLVRREALELALYTFKYVPGIDYVVALIPPKPGTQPEFSVYFRRADLAAQLDHPLVDTLGPKTPGAGSISTSETEKIDRLAPTYRFALQQDQLGDVVLLLEPAV